MPHYLKLFQPLVRYIHRQFIKNYDICFIPDFPGRDGLSGKLAHASGTFNFPHHFLGSLSGFLELTPKPSTMVPDVLAVISGPEPQRTVFIEKLLALFANDKRQVWLIAGQPDVTYDHTDDHIRIINHLKRAELKYLMQSAPVLITRSGYTTLMDLYEIKRKAILIPTPGQTEQEYLGKYFSEKYKFKVQEQKKITDPAAFREDFCGKWEHNQEQTLINISQCICRYM